GQAHNVFGTGRVDVDPHPVGAAGEGEGAAVGADEDAGLTVGPFGGVPLVAVRVVAVRHDGDLHRGAGEFRARGCGDRDVQVLGGRSGDHHGAPAFHSPARGACTAHRDDCG